MLISPIKFGGSSGSGSVAAQWFGLARMKEFPRKFNSLEITLEPPLLLSRREADSLGKRFFLPRLSKQFSAGQYSESTFEKIRIQMVLVIFKHLRKGLFSSYGIKSSVNYQYPFPRSAEIAQQAYEAYAIMKTSP